MTHPPRHHFTLHELMIVAPLAALAFAAGGYVWKG